MIDYAQIGLCEFRSIQLLIGKPRNHVLYDHDIFNREVNGAPEGQVFVHTQIARVDSEGTCRLSLKMGMGDEQKTVMYGIRW